MSITIVFFILCFKFLFLISALS